MSNKPKKPISEIYYVFLVAFIFNLFVLVDVYRSNVEYGNTDLKHWVAFPISFCLWGNVYTDFLMKEKGVPQKVGNIIVIILFVILLVVNAYSFWRK